MLRQGVEATAVNEGVKAATMDDERMFVSCALPSSVRVALLPLDGAVLSESEVAGRVFCS